MVVLCVVFSLLQTAPSQEDPPSGVRERVSSHQHFTAVPSSLVRHTRNRSLDSGTARQMLENSDTGEPKQGNPPEGEESKEGNPSEGEESKEIFTHEEESKDVKFTVGDDSAAPSAKVAVDLEEVSVCVLLLATRRTSMGEPKCCMSTAAGTGK